MTPLFQHPDNYLYNLIAMTSPEAKRLWRRAIKEHFDNTCIYCGKTHDTTDLTIDHVHPKSLGGNDHTANCVCACRRCNQLKGTNNWLTFMREHFGINALRERLILSHIS